MAELIFIIGGSVIGAVITSKSVSVVFTTIKPTQIIKYKYYKRRLKNNLKKAITDLDYELFYDEFQKVKTFDGRFCANKYQDFKKKFGVNNEIINDKKLFRIKFDPEYLINVVNTTFSSTSEELLVKELELKHKEDELKSFDDYNIYKTKEEELNQRQLSLDEQEEELNHKVRNFLLIDEN